MFVGNAACCCREGGEKQQVNLLFQLKHKHNVQGASRNSCVVAAPTK